MKDGNLWRYDKKNDMWATDKLQTLFKDLPEDVSGGVQCRRGFNWFFRGHSVWSYQGNMLRSGFPRVNFNPLHPKSPSTAVNKNGKVYLLKVFRLHSVLTALSIIFFFKRDQAFELDTDTLAIVGNPTKITYLFPGLPAYIEVVS